MTRVETCTTVEVESKRRVTATISDVLVSVIVNVARCRMEIVRVYNAFLLGVGSSVNVTREYSVLVETVGEAVTSKRRKVDTVVVEMFNWVSFRVVLALPGRVM